MKTTRTIFLIFIISILLLSGCKKNTKQTLSNDELGLDLSTFINSDADTTLDLIRSETECEQSSTEEGAYLIREKLFDHDWLTEIKTYEGKVVCVYKIYQLTEDEILDGTYQSLIDQSLKALEDKYEKSTDYYSDDVVLYYDKANQTDYMSYGETWYDVDSVRISIQTGRNSGVLQQFFPDEYINGYANIVITYENPRENETAA